jgi:hypothetical protein
MRKDKHPVGAGNMREATAQTKRTLRRAYLPLRQAAYWAGMSAEQLRRMVCRHQVCIYRPAGPRGVALVRLSELRAALERTRWPEPEQPQETSAHA